jgi:ribosome production factor 2
VWLQEKNVGSEMLKGKVGRIYMPRQEVDMMALAKPKGLKRSRREAAAEAKAAKAGKSSGGSKAAVDGAEQPAPAKRQRG